MIKEIRILVGEQPIAGYAVIAIARHEGEELAAAMRDVGCGEGGSLHFRSFDLGKIPDIPDLVRALRKEFGSIYGLVKGERLEMLHVVFVGTFSAK